MLDLLYFLTYTWACCLTLFTGAFWFVSDHPNKWFVRSLLTITVMGYWLAVYMGGKCF